MSDFIEIESTGVKQRNVNRLVKDVKGRSKLDTSELDGGSLVPDDTRLTRVIEQGQRRVNSRSHEDGFDTFQ
jgi:hypothetical protein